MVDGFAQLDRTIKREIMSSKKNKYFVLSGDKATNKHGWAELWERYENKQTTGIARLFVETTSGTARRVAKILNAEHVAKEHLKTLGFPNKPKKRKA